MGYKYGNLSGRNLTLSPLVPKIVLISSCIILCKQCTFEYKCMTQPNGIFRKINNNSIRFCISFIVNTKGNIMFLKIQYITENVITFAKLPRCRKNCPSSLLKKKHIVRKSSLTPIIYNLHYHHQPSRSQNAYV